MEFPTNSWNFFPMADFNTTCAQDRGNLNMDVLVQVLVGMPMNYPGLCIRIDCIPDLDPGY
jgi:hypothetical protein